MKTTPLILFALLLALLITLHAADFILVAKGRDAAAKAQVLANWARVDVMEMEYPPFAINWRSETH